MESARRRYESYLESWSEEIKARANRIRYLIGDAHWLSDGSHKEHVIREFLIRHAPAASRISHGFIRDIQGGCSNEVDVLITRGGSFPPYFSEGGLEVVPPEDVLGTLEIKSMFGPRELQQALARSRRIHSIFEADGVSLRPWQGGVFFAQDKSLTIERVLDVIEREIRQSFAATPLRTSPMMGESNIHTLTCMVVVDCWVAMVRPADGTAKIRVDLFESGTRSFALAAIDLLAHLSASLTGSFRPTAIESGNSVMDGEQHTRIIDLRAST